MCRKILTEITPQTRALTISRALYSYISDHRKASETETLAIAAINLMVIKVQNHLLFFFNTFYFSFLHVEKKKWKKSKKKKTKKNRGCPIPKPGRFYVFFWFGGGLCLIDLPIERDRNTFFDPWAEEFGKTQFCFHSIGWFPSIEFVDTIRYDTIRLFNCKFPLSLLSPLIRFLI